MKKILFSVFLVITAGITGLFAQSGKTTDPYLQASFHQHFTPATGVQWKQLKNYAEATFTVSGQVLTAYYYVGSLQPFAVSRNIAPPVLPLHLLADIRKNYSNYWITGLFELAIDAHSEYYITLEKADAKIVLQSDDAGSWSVYHSPGSPSL